MSVQAMLCEGRSCLNGGICVYQQGIVGCVCPAKYHGEWCQNSDRAPLPVWGVELIVLMILLVVGGIMVTLFCLIRKRKSAPLNDVNDERDVTQPVQTPTQTHLAQLETDLHY